MLLLRVAAGALASAAAAEAAFHLDFFEHTPNKKMRVFNIYNYNYYLCVCVCVGGNK